jgi:predicted transcriptional regulator
MWRRFRLVSLQLERLSTLRSRAKRREAIQVLPKTLDDFYHRLLEDIDDNNRDILKKALIWLLLSARPLTVAELAEAVIVSPTRPFFDPDERFIA